MTDQQQSTPEPTTEPEPPTQEPDQQAEPHANAEAAKWRRALRAAEAERDGYKEQVDGYQREQVEAMAADLFTSARDLWTVTSVDKMRGEDGQIDRDLAASVMRDVLKDRPHWTNTQAERDASRAALRAMQGARPGEIEEPSFGSALRKALGS